MLSTRAYYVLTLEKAFWVLACAESKVIMLLSENIEGK